MTTLIDLVVSLVLTLAIELIVALCFKVRGKGLILVLLVNIITNPMAVLLARYADLYCGEAADILKIVIETAVLICECRIYMSFAEDSRMHISKPLALSAVSNILSYCLGLIANELWGYFVMYSVFLF